MKKQIFLASLFYFANFSLCIFSNSDYKTHETIISDLKLLYKKNKEVKGNLGKKRSCLLKNLEKKKARIKSGEIGDCKDCKRYRDKKGIITKIECCKTHAKSQDLYDHRRFNEEWDYGIMESIEKNSVNKNIIYIAVLRYIKARKKMFGLSSYLIKYRNFLKRCKNKKEDYKEILKDIRTDQIILNNIKVLNSVFSDPTKIHGPDFLGYCEDLCKEKNIQIDSLFI